MAQREWLIAAREKLGYNVEQAADRLHISETLLTWLEKFDETITHPGIADRIREMYKLTLDQRNDLVAVQYEITDKPKRRRKVSPP